MPRTSSSYLACEGAPIPGSGVSDFEEAQSLISPRSTGRLDLALHVSGMNNSGGGYLARNIQGGLMAKKKARAFS